MSGVCDVLLVYHRKDGCPRIALCCTPSNRILFFLFSFVARTWTLQ